MQGVHSIGISPAEKIFEDKPYVITILGEPLQEVTLSAPKGVTLSAYNIILSQDGKQKIDVTVDKNQLIPGENILYINALTMPTNDAQIRVVTEVGHKLLVYRDSDEDYIIHRPFADSVEQKLGVFGKVLSLYEIKDISLTIDIDTIHKILHAYNVESKEEFEISETYEELGIPRGYRNAEFLLEYGEKQEKSNISFVVGEPKVSALKLEVLSVSDGVTAVNINFFFDWNREQLLEFGEIGLFYGQKGYKTAIPGMVVQPGNNSQTVYVSTELAKGIYETEILIQTQDGIAKTKGKLKFLDEDTNSKKTINVFIIILKILIILLILSFLYVFRGPIIKIPTYMRRFLTKRQRNPVPRHKRIKW